MRQEVVASAALFKEARELLPKIGESASLASPLPPQANGASLAPSTSSKPDTQQQQQHQLPRGFYVDANRHLLGPAPPRQVQVRGCGAYWRVRVIWACARMLDRAGGGRGVCRALHIAPAPLGRIALRLEAHCQVPAQHIQLLSLHQQCSTYSCAAPLQPPITASTACRSCRWRIRCRTLTGCLTTWRWRWWCRSKPGSEWPWQGWRWG